MANVRYFQNGKLVTADGAFALTPKKGCCPTLEETPEKVMPASATPSPQEQGKIALEKIASSERLVVISLPQCPQCEVLADALSSRGVPSSVFTKWDKASPEYPSLKEAMISYAGKGFTFPQVFAEGKYQGGFDAVMTKLEDGAFDALLEDAFDIEPRTVQKLVDRQPMVCLSLTHCPQCDELKERLSQKGLPVGDIFVKWDKATPQYQSLKAQLIKLNGQSQFTFPQTFVQSTYKGGFAEMMTALDSGDFDDFFADTYGIAKPQRAEAPAAEPQMVFDDDMDF